MIGADEVGRGALAGPIVAAAVRWDPNTIRASEALSGLADSKKLTPARRAALVPIISELVEAIAIVQISHLTIDSEGIEWANNQSLRSALRSLSPRDGLSSATLVDGLGRGQDDHTKAIVKGDSRSAAIAMAAVIAKEHRDRLMRMAGERWPGYGMERHSGYGTSAHKEAISKLGPSPWQRLTFKSD